jgi:hypothetical protein
LQFKERDTLLGSGDALASATLSSDGHYLIAGDTHGSVKLWDLSQATSRNTLEHDTGVWALAAVVAQTAPSRRTKPTGVSRRLASRRHVEDWPSPILPRKYFDASSSETTSANRD